MLQRLFLSVLMLGMCWTHGAFSVQTNPTDGCPDGQYKDFINGDCVDCDGIRNYVVGDFCKTCENGSFANADHTDCFQCGAGGYINYFACENCHAGYYCPGNGGAFACPVGTYSAGVRATACSPCNTGFSTSSTGATSCDICATGYYKSGDDCIVCTPGNPECSGGGDTGCPMGTYEQNGVCVACTVGYFCAGGNEGPVICRKGSFSTGGAASCTKCPENYTTVEAGATSSEMCVYANIKLKFGTDTDGTQIDLPSSLKYGRINTSVVKKIRK